MSSKNNNPFDLFKIAPSFEIDLTLLEGRYQTMIKTVHPDKFAARPAAEQRVAQQWSARINEAYETLKDPLKRATWLCESRGAPIEAETNTSMPMDFIMTQIELREIFEQSAGNLERLEALKNDIQTRYASIVEEIEQALNAADQSKEAALAVRRLMFIDKFSRDIDREISKV